MIASPKPHLGDVGALVAPVQQRLQLLGNPRAGIDTDLRVVVDQAIRPYRQAPPADQHDRRGGGAGVGVSSAIQIYRIGGVGASRRGSTRSRIWKRLTACSFRTRSPEQPEPQTTASLSGSANAFTAACIWATSDSQRPRRLPVAVWPVAASLGRPTPECGINERRKVAFTPLARVTIRRVVLPCSTAPPQRTTGCCCPEGVSF
jgi:hypothetical protein